MRKFNRLINRLCALRLAAAALGIALAAAVAVTAFAQAPAPADTPVAAQPSAQPAGTPSAPMIATASLPRDLSPWGMFLNADIVVKIVMVGLIFASLVTWTVWLAKNLELWKATRNGRKELAVLYV
jgi:biopolymer transport protein ExbB